MLSPGVQGRSVRCLRNSRLRQAGVGTSPVALVAAALATCAACRALLPAPQPGPGEELGAWWRDLAPAWRVVLGAALGAGLAWSAWLVRHPALGHDMLLYHVPEAIGWVRSGSPGSIDPIVDVLPVGAYPVTHEVLLAWGLGISRGLATASLLTIALIALLVLSAWTGLRTLGAGREVAALGAAALVALPATIASQSGGGTLDPAATAWLCACAALSAGALRGRAALVGPAIVAGGLAAGTKTTALPLVLLVVATTLFACRRRLRPLVRPLAAAVGAALVVGGTWYARNLVSHGSPLWPFMSAPWGDPQPALYRAADVTFLDRPGDTLSRLGDYYAHHFAGGIALLAGALIAPVLAWRREVVAAALVTLLSVLLWANAPFTGVLATSAFDVGTGDATRYLLPGLVAAVLTLGLAARPPTAGWRRLVVMAFLGAAVILGARDTLALGFPSSPSLTTPVIGAVGGALALWALDLVPAGERWRPSRGWARAAAVACILGAGALGAVVSHGYVERHADTGLFDAGVVHWFAGQAEWRGGTQPIGLSGSLLAPLAGDRLRHPMRLVRAGARCQDVVDASRRGWLVLRRSEPRTSLGARDRTTAERLQLCLSGRRAVYSDSEYSVYRAAPLR